MAKNWNTEGLHNNTAIGADALLNLIVGSGNVAIGDYSGSDLVTENNIFVLRVHDKEYKTEMTDDESEIIREVIKRAIKGHI